jgi:Mce-associated membrane protein
MPSRKLPAEALDADNPQAGVLAAPAHSLGTDADELAQIEARAEVARARAIRLREQAEAAPVETGVERGASAAFDTAFDNEEPAPTGPRRWLRRPSRRPSRKAAAIAAAVVVACASLTASGYVVWHHRNVAQQQQRTAEFAMAARNGVVAMMAINATDARNQLQSFADETTGEFKAGILMGAEKAVKDIEQSKVSVKATVQAAAVQSMTEDSAVVLVAAKSEITKPDQAKPVSRSWRIVVDVERDAGTLKISKVEFVP